MAQYKILSFNYITSGEKQKFVSFDIQNGDKIHKNVVFATDTEESINKIDENTNTQSLFDVENNLIIHNLYDVKDMCIKSAIPNGNVKTNEENRILFTNKKIDPNIFIDIYAPDMDDNPIDMVQLKNVSYMMTDRTLNSPNFKITDLENRKSDPPSQITNNNYTWKIEGGKLPTYIYGSNKITSDVSSVFHARYNLNGIKYNYIVELPQNDYYYNNLTEGNLEGDVFVGKNVYDNTYSMNMNDMYHINDCREYCGLGVCGDKLFLKYYDNINYNGDFIYQQYYELSAINMTSSYVNDNKKYPFQKVEILDSINRFRRDVNHKSGLYSIQLNNTGLDPSSLSSSELSSLVIKMRNDIHNSIKDITKRVCPVNTQLFNVFFKGE